MFIETNCTNDKYYYQQDRFYSTSGAEGNARVEISLRINTNVEGESVFQRRAVQIAQLVRWKSYTYKSITAESASIFHDVKLQYVFSLCRPFDVPPCLFDSIFHVVAYIVSSICIR
ncbi:hypothetical protein T08_11245 [Trichinella sp. T8]|nr:hypothetical protein T08_11245 [Trichinella sp. T8]